MFFIRQTNKQTNKTAAYSPNMFLISLGLLESLKHCGSEQPALLTTEVAWLAGTLLLGTGGVQRSALAPQGQWSCTWSPSSNAPSSPTPPYPRVLYCFVLLSPSSPLLPKSPPGSLGHLAQLSFNMSEQVCVLSLLHSKLLKSTDHISCLVVMPRDPKKLLDDLLLSKWM